MPNGALEGLFYVGEVESFGQSFSFCGRGAPDGLHRRSEWRLRAPRRHERDADSVGCSNRLPKPRCQCHGGSNCPTQRQCDRDADGLAGYQRCAEREANRDAHGGTDGSADGEPNDRPNRLIRPYGHAGGDARLYTEANRQSDGRPRERGLLCGLEQHRAVFCGRDRLVFRRELYGGVLEPRQRPVVKQRCRG